MVGPDGPPGTSPAVELPLATTPSLVSGLPAMVGPMIVVTSGGEFRFAVEAASFTVMRSAVCCPLAFVSVACPAR
jgi:hypothetical protein